MSMARIETNSFEKFRAKENEEKENELNKMMMERASVVRDEPIEK